MGVNSLPKTVTRQHRDCDFNPGPSAPESSTLNTRLPIIQTDWQSRGQTTERATGAAVGRILMCNAEGDAA